MSRAELFNVVKFMANIQRNGTVYTSAVLCCLSTNVVYLGTFSVIPRIAAGEITPDKLIILGQVAKKCESRLYAHNSKGSIKRSLDGLYTKITGGQRIDMFGAQKADLPSIWKELVDAGFESGHAYGMLKKILLEDELGICADLEREMDNLVGTYRDEWSIVANDPERQKQFRQFVNTDERVVPVEQISERGQSRPAYWPKTSSAVHIRADQIRTSKDQWEWRRLAGIADLTPTDAGTTYGFCVFLEIVNFNYIIRSAAVKYGGSQLAIFHVPRRGYFATQRMYHESFDIIFC
ncbi:hypothetical protein EIP86_006452 [Pleurotus ostreatoroseus]|nr:hypothetical protein EIP86_006452 [Pleurotus ostreatoroseus]